MPDVRDLLRTAAGDPVVPLDLDDVLRRGARRTARRRGLIAGAVALPVAAAAALVVGGLPGGPAQERLAAPTASPGTPATASSPGQVPAPTSPADATARPGDSGVDGQVYAFLTAVDEHGYGLTYDKVDFKGPACVAGLPPLRRHVAAQCYSDTNPLLRRATGSASTVVVLADSTGQQTRGTWADLRAAVRDPQLGPLSTRPWLLTLAGGRITRVVGQVYDQG